MADQTPFGSAQGDTGQGSSLAQGDITQGAHAASAGTQLPAPPAIPSGEEIYDRIMGQIEPELVTAVLPTLKEKYKDETQEEAKVRAVRYQKAFAEYDKQYAAYLQSQEGALRSYQMNLGRAVENVARSDEAPHLGDLESAISAA